MDVLLPQFAAATTDSVELDADVVKFQIRSKSDSSACPGFRESSARVHARYQRRLADLPVSDRNVQVIAHIRGFKCVNSRCSQSPFAEQIQGLTTPFARRNSLRTGALVELAFSLAAVWERCSPRHWPCRVAATC